MGELQDCVSALCIRHRVLFDRNDTSLPWSLMELPLLDRIEQPGSFVTLATMQSTHEEHASFCGVKRGNQPLRMPGPGEQYRFHFDMTKCIGCKCCVVACIEQNGNSPDILWRRVGEIEGGVYP